MTGILILNSVLVLFTASILGVMAFKGHHDFDPLTEKGSKQRIIPPFLTKENGMGVYEGFYSGSFVGPLPGNPNDKKPEGEPDPAKDLPPGAEDKGDADIDEE